MKTWGLYSLIDDEGKDQFKNSGNLLSTSTMLFGDNIYGRKERIYEPFGSGVAQNIPIQTGGFSAPVDETPKQTKAPAAPAEPDAPTSWSDFSEDELDKLGIKIDFSKLSSFATGVATTTGTAIAGTALYEAIRDPEGAGAAFARDTAMEAALLAAKAPAAVAGAAVMAVDPDLGTNISPSTIRPEEDDMTYSGIIPLSDESIMEDIATRDSAMRLKPEAGKNFIPAPEVEDDNFLNMKP